MTPEEQVARAAQARNLLDNPLLADTFQRMKDEVIAKWQKSPADDAKGREQCWTTLKLIEKLEGTLRLTVEQGKVAQATLLQRATEAARELTRRTGVRPSR